MIYAIMAENGLMKIGRSHNPKTRYRQIKSASPIEIRWFAFLDEVKYPEETIHKRFVKKRIRGEWFALDDDDMMWLLDNSTDWHKEWLREYHDDPIVFIQTFRLIAECYLDRMWGHRGVFI